MSGSLDSMLSGLMAEGYDMRIIEKPEPRPRLDAIMRALLGKQAEPYLYEYHGGGKVMKLTETERQDFVPIEMCIYGVEKYRKMLAQKREDNASWREMMEELKGWQK